MQCHLSLKGKVITVPKHKMCRGVEMELHELLTSALDRNEWSSSHSGHLCPWRNSPCTYLTENISMTDHCVCELCSREERGVWVHRNLVTFLDLRDRK
jgi:hypothetical protein